MRAGAPTDACRRKARRGDCGQSGSRSVRSQSFHQRWADSCIGQEVARQLGVRFIFVEKEDGKLVLRRGFKIAPGEKILIVEDVVTKGGRVQETMDIVRAHGGNLTGVAMVVDRSNGKTQLGVPQFSLIAMQVEAFDPNNLPPDLAKIPAVKPGSK